MKYEIMVLLMPNLGQEKTSHELSEIKKMITSLGGEILNEDDWGQRELAYSIKKQTHAYYTVMTFELEPLKSKELEKTLNIYPALIRYLITKCPKGYELVTMSTYKAEAEVALKEKQELAAEKAEKRAGPSRKPAAAPRAVEKPVKPKKVVEEPEEPAEKPAEKPVEEPAEPIKPKEEPKDERLSLEEMDKKLRSIIEDPDITL
ncbi:MAG: 30S ribosomal protein S6 [Candidatus Gracilibacteria bacterium]